MYRAAKKGKENMENKNDVWKGLLQKGDGPLTLDAWFEDWLVNYKLLTVKKGTIEN